MADQTTVNAAFGWRPDIVQFAPVDAVPTALILKAATVLGDVEGDQPSLHVPFVVDDLNVPFIAEDSELDATDPQLAEVLVHTAKASMLTRISYEQWIKAQTAGQLATSFARSLAWASDKAFLSQVAPTSPAVAPPAGLQNISGLVAGGAISHDLDPLADLIGELQFNNSHPNLIVVDPIGWSNLRKLKLATTWNATLLGAGVEDTQARLLGIPVAVTRFAPTNGGFVIDSTAIAAAVGPVRVATSEHTYFSSDAIALRATWRFGWNVIRPNRIGTFTIGTVGS